MTQQVESLAAEFRAINDSARALVDRAGIERLTERPAKGGWSIAECLEHLNLTTRAYLPLWRTALAQAPHGAGPYKTDFWGKILIWMLEPPPKFKMPTTQPFIPLQTPPPDQVLPVFLATQDELLAALSGAEGRAVDKVKVRSPFNQRMQYNVWSSFCVQAPHQRRHLWQATKVLAL
jgi:hypothetical protein